jgi:Fic family protein
VRIKRKLVGRHIYYYLEHSTRNGTRVHKKEIYLGKKLPKNIEEVKKSLLADIFRARWHPLLEKVRTRYASEAALMPKSAIEKEVETFSIRFTYDTQRIEGSTLSLRETANLLERGITPKDKPIQDVKEAEEHNKLFKEVLGYKKDLSLGAVLEWHRRLFWQTKPDIAGRVRKTRVGIAGSKFVPPLPVEIYPMLREFFGWYQKSRNRLHPVELAALVHLKFVTIHPFADGNGRISRLMMNFVLNRKRYPMFNIPYEGRNSYYNALERAQTSKRDDVFVRWLVKRYVKAYFS